MIKMGIHSRESEYIKILSERDYSVKELSDKLFISEPTVRRDILQLKKKDLITSHRGIVSINRNSPDQRIPLFIRDFENIEEKKRIAKIASGNIKDGDAIMLDASTTAYCLLPYLTQFRNLYVITSGAKTAIALASMGIKTLCTGGEMILESFSYVGPDAESLLEKYHADIAFFSCRGLSENGIATDNSIPENNIRRIMIKNSKRKYLLCDNSKIGNIYLNTLCSTKEINDVIS